MKVLRQNRYRVKLTHPDYALFLRHMKESRAVYNFANFLVRQGYFRRKGKKFNTEFLNEFNDDPSLCTEIETYFKEGKNFTSRLHRILCVIARRWKCDINAKIVQGVIRHLQADWISFFELLKKKKDGSYDEKVRPPRYKKEAFNLVEYNPQTISKKKLHAGFIGTAKMAQGVKLRSLKPNETVQAFRVDWKNECVQIEVIFKREIDIPRETGDGEKIASVDLGVDNLMTVAFNYERRPVVISGMEIKSLNRFFNKEKGKLQGELPNKTYSSRNIRRLMGKRYEQIRNLFGRITNKFVAFLICEGVTKLIVGYSEGWKDEVHIGKKNNQNFVQIPFLSLVKILRYKCEEAGIRMVIQEESYTSKASFIDNDAIPTFRKLKKDEEKPVYKFSGHRQKRGLYKTKNGVFINADLNGALNIMRKAGGLSLEKTSSLTYLTRYTHICPISLDLCALSQCKQAET